MCVLSAPKSNVKEYKYLSVQKVHKKPFSKAIRDSTNQMCAPLILGLFVFIFSVQALIWINRIMECE